MAHNNIAKPVKLIFFDLDGTLVDGLEYIYQHLWDYFGVDKSQTREVLKSYLRGDITYVEWVNNDVKLLRDAKATKDQIRDAIKQLRPMKGAPEVLAKLKKQGYKIFIVSGGMDLVVKQIYPNYTEIFEDIFINRYHFGDDGVISHATPTPYDMEHKATCIKDMSKKHGVSTNDCIFVGDNVNDVDAAMVAGVSIAFNSKSDELVQVATHHVESADLTDILKYLK